eukprot:CAMPEP_0113898786 /NCGR_PEP_ID=MMETSP0780_2-20120614/19614_1 /TAXON_ID=652834 /ORGANISM="Palpitomonas bilix" /LENGTH=146 /DNA_ID=CAMNT_0000890771 /DNA_START=45 /DNA_END=485 /DNA_ORIENTATION=- /assembly_acc=CAM_ASM_000599
MANTKDVKQAQKAKKAVTKGTHIKKTRKIRTTVAFHRPKTLQRSRQPQYARKSRSSSKKFDAHAIVKYPLKTESTMQKLEDGMKTFTFICDVRANKNQIRAALKRLYDIECTKINTLVRPDGLKKAYCKLAPDYDVGEVAGNIGLY